MRVSLIDGFEVMLSGLGGERWRAERLVALAFALAFGFEDDLDWVGRGGCASGFGFGDKVTLGGGLVKGNCDSTSLGSGMTSKGWKL